MILTEALLGEHAVFYAQFDHLVQTVPGVGDLTIIQAQTALIASALATHAQLEEDLLFKALDPHLGEMGPLAVMRMEHQEIESTSFISPGSTSPKRSRSCTRWHPKSWAASSSRRLVNNGQNAGQ